MSVHASRPVFLDSNVVLRLLSADNRKADQAQQLLQSGPIVSVQQVLNEVTAVCRRKLNMPWLEVQTLVDTVKAFCKVEAVTTQSHALAMVVAERYQLSFYDAHIAASAVQADAQTLYSEDTHNGMQIQGLKIRNPFVAH